MEQFAATSSAPYAEAEVLPLPLEERLDEVRQLTSELTPIDDMAVLLGVPELELRQALSDPASPVRKAYRMARAEAARQIRLDDIEQAAGGSPQAQEMLSEHLRRMIASE